MTAQRSRQSIVTREVLAEARLVRFVAGPDGAVVPDVGRKLPGRGLWVEAERARVDEAAKKNAFSRAAKTQLRAPADLVDQVQALLERRVLAALGLAKRAGELISGFDKVAEAVRNGRAAWLIEARDGSADGRRKLLALAKRADRPPRLFGVFTSGEMGLALGLDNVIHTAFLAGRGAGRWTEEVERLSGFRPLFPESWREEP